MEIPFTYYNKTEERSYADHRLMNATMMMQNDVISNDIENVPMNNLNAFFW